MEVTYDGTLVMPSSYALMDEEEMMYVEGGTSTIYGTAKQLASKAKYEMSIFYSASGVGGSATVTSSVLAAASIIGVPVSIVLESIGGVMTGYATHVGNCYIDAYNYFMDRISKSGTYYMRTITASGFITGVTTGRK